MTECSTSPLLPLDSIGCAVFLFGIDAHLRVCVYIYECEWQQKDGRRTICRAGERVR